MGGRSVLILRRFDRTRVVDRIGYISAMTATGSDDDEHRDYADAAEAMRDLSRSPEADHHELFDRVATSVALGNTDDQLRKHGFIADRGSWTSSPAFDVNPNPDPWRPRSTSIMGADATPDEADGLLALAEDCSLTSQQAHERLLHIAGTLPGSKNAARRNRIGEHEISMMTESIEPRREAVVKAA